MLDGIDRRLLQALQRDARRTNAELAEEVGLSMSACAKRVSRLWSEGLIAGAVAILDRRRFRRPVTAMVTVSLTSPTQANSDAFARAMLRHDEVAQMHTVTGDFDFLLLIQERSIESYHAFAQATLGALPFVQAYKTTFVLGTQRNRDRLPAFCLVPAEEDEPPV